MKNSVLEKTSEKTIACDWLKPHSDAKKKTKDYELGPCAAVLFEAELAGVSSTPCFHSKKQRA
jgi:hypothetical protein